MPAPIYDITTTADVTVSTVKSVLGAKAHANSGLLLVGWEISFEGTTATNEPALVEICSCTFATNSPGTNSTSETIVQRNGRVLTAGFTAARAWSSEPTTVTPLWTKKLTPNGGLIIYDYPLGKEPDSALAEGFVMRVTAANSVDLRATLSVSRC